MDGTAALQVAEIATFRFLRCLFFFFSVKRSQKVWVGCSWAPSPPLITGRAKVGGEPRGAVARMADDDNVGIVSDDPDRIGEAFALAAELVAGSALVMVLPPRRSMALSKDRRVRVLGS